MAKVVSIYQAKLRQITAQNPGKIRAAEKGGNNRLSHHEKRLLRRAFNIVQE